MNSSYKATYADLLRQIDNEHRNMVDTLVKWSNINSHSYNLAGLDAMLKGIRVEFENLQNANLNLCLDIKEIKLQDEQIISSKGKQERLPLGRALCIRKKAINEKTKIIRVLLGGHMDTVFPIDSHFQNTKFIDDNTLNGPGVADLKGGLIVMIKALEYFEKSDFADKIAWEILINPDEELGSPGSAPILAEAAVRNDIGLIFEPALSDGALAYKRKGSGNFTIVVKGKSAHVGRAFDKGRNAIVALSHCIQKLNALNKKHDGIILNIGKVEGGGPVNVVPDLAIAKINVRVDSVTQEAIALEYLKQIISEVNENTDSAFDGIETSLHGGFNRTAKIPDTKTDVLFDLLQECGDDLNIKITKQNTGGCCDGNNLFAAGLPNIDTMGVRGGNIHSDQEYILLDSLVERAKLSTLFLMKLANHEGLCEDKIC